MNEVHSRTAIAQAAGTAACSAVKSQTALSLHRILPKSRAAVCRNSPQPLSDEADKGHPVANLSDAQREQYISFCGRQLKAAYARYEASSCLTDLGDSQHWLMLQNQAIRGRSAAQVAKLEKDRGLA